MKHLLLSTNGGDRATGYTMSNKLIALPEGYLVTWIDSHRQNQWAIVAPGNASISRNGPLGTPCVDNHCGAALVLAQDGVHAITGAHHGPFEHFRMELSTKGGFRHVATIDVEGTYPNVTADATGRLHLAFRAPGDRWSLGYCRYENGRWSFARSLVVAEPAGYIYWTNGLTVGPGDVLHLLFGNTRVLPERALLYGASHIASCDGGDTWRDTTDRVLSLPAATSALPLLVDEADPTRTQSLTDQQAHEAPGPRNFNYQQINLSNPVVDPQGAVHVVLHNGLTGTADLMSRSTVGRWAAESLTAAATGGDPKSRIHLQSSLARLPDGRLRAALMIEQTEESVWGASGTSIVCVETGANGKPEAAVRVTPTDPSCANWLPAQPHHAASMSEQLPPLLYTRGVNAGGFAHNQNRIETQVYFCSL